MSEINKDKFVTCKNFKTALKKLSKMVQTEKEEVFETSLILEEYQKGIKRNKETKWRNMETNEINEEVVEEGRFYQFWRMSDGSYFRLQIERMTENKWYIDCGCNCCQ